MILFKSIESCCDAVPVSLGKKWTYSENGYFWWIKNLGVLFIGKGPRVPWILRTMFVSELKIEMGDQHSHIGSHSNESHSNIVGEMTGKWLGVRRQFWENLFVTIGMLFGFLLADDLYEALLKRKGNPIDRSYLSVVEQHETSMTKQWERFRQLKGRKAIFEKRLWEVDQDWCLEHLTATGGGDRRFWASVMPRGPSMGDLGHVLTY